MSKEKNQKNIKYMNYEFNFFTSSSYLDNVINKIIEKRERSQLKLTIKAKPLY